jgi:methyl-galactoside transport system substrate-binding protein
MKKVLILLSGLLLGCQPQVREVPVLYYDMKDAYIADFKERLSLLEREPLIHVDGRNGVNTQNEQFSRWIESHQVLVINPVDRLSVLPMILKANQLNKTLIFFNREPLDEDFERADSAYYVGADPYQSALLQTDLVDELEFTKLDRNEDGIIQLVILKGEQGHQDAEIRTRGVIETLTAKGYSIELLEIRVANFDREQASKATLELIETYPQMELIISNNDAMALGAIDALVSSNWIIDENQNEMIDENEPWFPVIGIDGLPEAIESMQKGYLFGTVKNDSEAMADAIVQLIDIVLNKASWDDLTYTIENNKIYIDYILINRP